MVLPQQRGLDQQRNGRPLTPQEWTNHPRIVRLPRSFPIYLAILVEREKSVGPCLIHGDELACVIKGARSLPGSPTSSFLHVLFPPLDGLPSSLSLLSLAPLEPPCTSCHSFWSAPFRWRRWLACISIGILNTTVQDTTGFPETTTLRCRTNTKDRRSSSEFGSAHPPNCLSLIGSPNSVDGISSILLIQLTET